MKRAKRAQRNLKPRDPVAVAEVMKKGGAHRRRDRKASRALQKTRSRRELRAEDA
jgi:hypothetical protein